MCGDDPGVYYSTLYLLVAIETETESSAVTDLSEWCAHRKRLLMSRCAANNFHIWEKRASND